MKRYTLEFFIIILIAALVPAAMAQDLHKSYSIAPGGYVRIQNICGNITIVGYNGAAIVVNAVAEGPDRQLLTIEDLSTASGVELRVKYPEHSSTNASINFKVQMPARVDYNLDHINSVSGNIEITGVRGRLQLNSVSGRVTARDIAGTGNANSVSGGVEVEPIRIEGTSDMKFSSVSGSVIVVAPLAMDANLDLTTLSGQLETSFPIHIQEPRYGPGRSAHGSIGARPAFSLKISSVSGKVSLTGK